MTSGAWEGSYVPGGWTAVMSDGRWLLVDLAVDDNRVMECWQLMRTGADPDRVLDVLARAGISEMPAFAITATHVDGMRLILRRPAQALVDELPVHSAALTWSDTIVPAPGRVVLSGAEAAPYASTVPASSGVIPASALCISSAAQAPATPEVSTADDVEPPAQPMPTTAPPPPPMAPSAEPALPGPVVQAPSPPRSPGPPDYTSLFAGTVARDAFLVRLAEEAADAEEAGAPPSGAPAPIPAGVVEDQSKKPAARDAFDGAVPLEPDRSARATTPEDTGLIAAFPWGATSDSSPDSSPPAAPSLTGPDQPADTESLTRTVNRDELLALLQQPAGSAPIVGASVMAVFCGAGHPTSPFVDACRVCGGAVNDQSPTRIARPTLGVLRLPTGDTVALDRDVVLGRAPHAPATSAAEQPNLVKLADPGVSRNHARVTLHGWQVLLRDLGSANGTEIELPGQSRKQMRQNEDYPLEPGARIYVAGEMLLTFQVEE